MPLDVIIADDDEGESSFLSRECKAVEGIKVIAVADSGKKLVQLAAKLNPDIVITDIKMPGISGIQAARYIRKMNRDTSIIFLTAFEEYARQAFEVYALDYLVKPVDRERLHQTLERAKTQHHNRGKIICFPSAEHGRIYLNTSDIILIEAQGKKIRIVTPENEFYVNMAFNKVLRQTGKFLFQTSRSYLVNLNRVDTIRKANRSSFEVVFSNTDATALLSNRYYEDFRSKMKILKQKS